MSLLLWIACSNHLPIKFNFYIHFDAEIKWITEWWVIIGRQLGLDGLCVPLLFEKADVGQWVHSSLCSTDGLVLSQCSPNPSSVACFPVQSSEFPALLASTLPQLSLQLPTQSTPPVVFLFVSFHLSCPYCWLKSVSDHCTPCFHTSFPWLILPNCQSEATSFPYSKTSMQALPASRRKFPVSKAPQAPSNRPCCSPSTPHPTSLPLYSSLKWRWVQFSFVCLFFNILCSFTSSGSFAWSVNGLSIQFLFVFFRARHALAPALGSGYMEKPMAQAAEACSPLCLLPDPALSGTLRWGLSAF